MNNLERKLIKFGAWNGVAWPVLMLVGMAAFAGFFPAHPPSANAETIAAIYEEDLFSIRVGMVVLMFASAPFILFTSAMCVLLREVEGRAGFLTFGMLVSGYGFSLLTYFPAMWWLTAAFRPERGPEIIQLFNDIAWLQLVGGLFITWPLWVVLAIAGFVDDQAEPIFPRWYGYFNAWVAVLLLPAQLIFFVVTGPFAWNGLFAFWVPLIAFVIWMVVTASLMLKAAKRPA